MAYRRRIATIVIQPDTLPPIARASLLADHRNTVMGISVAHDAAQVASIDYDGVWIARDENTLAPLATQRMDGRGRGVALSPDGTRIAGLLALRDHSDTRYCYDVAVGQVAGGPTVLLAGERVRSVVWAPDSEDLVLSGPPDFRVHHRTGARVLDGTVPYRREPAEYWMGSCVTPDASRFYVIRNNQLGCFEVRTSRELPTPDLSRFVPVGAASEWDSEGLALSRAGQLATSRVHGGGTYVWDLATDEVIAELRWDGPQIYRTNVVFAPDGAQLVASFHHVITQRADGRVTHVLVDLRERRVVGGIATETRLNGFHSTACFSADGHRLYVSEGERIHVCKVA